MTRRVVVTGVGLVCALGIGTEESWKNLVAGQSGIRLITQFDTTGFDCKIAGEIEHLERPQRFEYHEPRRLKRAIDPAGVLKHFCQAGSGIGRRLVNPSLLCVRSSLRIRRMMVPS